MRVIDFIISAAGFIAAMALLAMVVITVTSVIVRSVTGTPIRGALELTTYWLMVAIAFGALGAAARASEHIEATILFDGLSPKYKVGWAVFAGTVTVAAALAVSWFGLQEAFVQQERGEFAGGSSLPIWPSRYWVFVGFGIFGLAVIANGVRYLTSRQAALEQEERVDDESGEGRSHGDSPGE